MEKNIYFNKRKVGNLHPVQKFSTASSYASCVLLEHQWMFEPFLIVVFESINCPQCEKMDLKIIQSLLERVQICKNAGKLQNLQNVEDLSEEQCSVQLFRTNKGLMNNQHKTKKVVDHPGNSHILRTKGSQTFEGGYLNNFSYFFVLWTICKHILCKMSYSGQY